ncbi:MAG: hypothetical protein R3C18_11880 [Planctomycetaceae bacterium]
MGRKSRKGAENTTKLQGLKYFRLIDDLLAGLRGQERSVTRRATRQLFCDQYIALLLLYFFNPTVTSLRGLQKFTTLEKVQKLCGVKPTSLGSLSEAARVFDPAVLEPIIAQLANQARHHPQPCLPPNRPHWRD